MDDDTFTAEYYDIINARKHIQILLHYTSYINDFLVMKSNHFSLMLICITIGKRIVFDESTTQCNSSW